MRTYGRSICNQINSAASNPTSETALGLTYYDAEKVLYQIAAYTGDVSYLTCAQNAEKIYRDNYVVRAGGGVPGYWAFSEGLRVDFEKTADAASKSAINLLANKAAFCTNVPDEWTQKPLMIREVAYCLMSFVDNEAVGGAPIPAARVTTLLNQLLSHIDPAVVLAYKASQAAEDDIPAVCDGKAYAQPFYFGLAMRTLIRYNAAHPDPRILPALEKLVAFMWDKLRYQPGVPTSGRFWYAQCSNPDNSWNSWTAAGGNLPADDLNLLFAPGFAWLYQQTGNPVYRDRGDSIWSVGVQDGTVNGLNSKQFNQNYMWSFDYLTWRR